MRNILCPIDISEKRAKCRYQMEITQKNSGLGEMDASGTLVGLKF